jgi:hypothetical protein
VKVHGINYCSGVYLTFKLKRGWNVLDTKTGDCPDFKVKFTGVAGEDDYKLCVSGFPSGYLPYDADSFCRDIHLVDKCGENCVKITVSSGGGNPDVDVSKCY